MTEKRTIKKDDLTDSLNSESDEHSPASPHCPQELVKSLRKQGIRVRLPGPLQERLQNDLMMEGWLGKRPKDEK